MATKLYTSKITCTLYGPKGSSWQKLLVKDIEETGPEGFARGAIVGGRRPPSDLDKLPARVGELLAGALVPCRIRRVVTGTSSKAIVATVKNLTGRPIGTVQLAFPIAGGGTSYATSTRGLPPRSEEDLAFPMHRDVVNRAIWKRAVVCGVTFAEQP